MVMKILITGASGQLGNEILRALREGATEIGPIPACYQGAQVVATDREELDVTDDRAVDAFVGEGDFDLIVNCSGFTNVDGCEVDREGAFRLNGDAVGYLAQAAELYGARFVHISTDYVFSGQEPGERLEDDDLAPKSAYGQSKLEGERQALEKCSRSFVLRTAWLYGYVGKNFVKTMVRLGASRDSVTVVDDQIGNPTSANDLAYQILQVAVTEEYGIYHCTGEGICSWADFAQAIMEEAELDCVVRRCSSAEYKQANPQSADRPAFSALRNKHLEDTVGNRMRPWRQALASYMANIRELGASPSWDELVG